MKKDFNAQPTTENITALTTAACKGDIDIIHSLLNRFGGAIINSKNAAGISALMLASLWNETDIVTLLLLKGADVNQKSDAGNTALMYATPLTVKPLLEKGADPFIRNNDGKDALELTKKLGRLEVAELIEQAVEQRQVENEVRIVHQGLREEMDVGPALRFKKKGPAAP